MTSICKVGIEDISVYVPSLYLDIEALANQRGLEYAKLSQGLGLRQMALPDTDEDAATMAANAVLSLMQKNNLKPADIGRIYLGTESALDGAKPTASYILEMLQGYYNETYGSQAWQHCDVTDITFACIGGVDALQNTLDWVARRKERIGIVVCSDFAKYDLASSGEYTQGAGAVALLIKQNPSLLALDSEWGTATESVHDFFKPRRSYSQDEFMGMLSQLTGQNLALKNQAEDNKLKTILAQGVVRFFSETPVFDGQFSNDCYQNRIGEALVHWAKQNPQAQPIANWKRLIFHLPYAFHGKRIATELYAKFVLNIKDKGQLSDKNFLKEVSKSEAYRQFCREKIEAGQQLSSRVGNVYTASIFLSFVSMLEAEMATENPLSAHTEVAFIAYGSGSKAKVFVGELQAHWQEKAQHYKLNETLDLRQAISFEQYELLHSEKIDKPLNPEKQGFVLKSIEQGHRKYAYSNLNQSIKIL
ncbi:MAG: hydroxymethylglutaryl-CoA synthase family protein [Bernardetiaceae bacterium]|nr:hydroxymethylglutaryl-CoA synthase family protein [Bernardetiaceae bacterium]